MTIHHMQLRKRSIGDLTCIQSSKICSKFSLYIINFVSTIMPAFNIDNIKLEKLKQFIGDMTQVVTNIEAGWQGVCPVTVRVYNISMLTARKDSSRARSVEILPSAECLRQYPREMLINFSLKLLVFGIGYLKNYLQTNFGMQALGDISKLDEMNRQLSETIDRQDKMDLPFKLYMSTVLIKVDVMIDKREGAITSVVRNFVNLIPTEANQIAEQ